MECTDHTYYCGVCKAARLKERIQEHNQGSGARYTRSRCPVKLLVHSRSLSKKLAYRVEYLAKKMARSRKADYIKNF